MLTYTVELKPQKEGGYTVTAPALPGCISEDDTVEEALENIKDAIEGYIHVMTKHNRKIIQSLIKAEKDYKAGRIKRIKSLKELRT